jgi:alpha-tubulin suppressor-like RCC1 family protein
MRRVMLATLPGLWLAAGLTATGSRAADAPSVVQVAAAMHVLVLFSDGTVTGLVNNRSGQITGAETSGLQRARVIDLPGRAVAIAAGGDPSDAVLDDGTVAVWGRGYAGELGVKLANGTWRGAMWFWGEREATAVLTGQRVNQRVPVTVPPAALRPPAP